MGHHPEGATWPYKASAKAREQPKEEGTRNMGADGRKSPIDGTLPTGTDPQLHSAGRPKQTRKGAWSTGNTKWREKQAAMTGTMCTTRATHNPTVKDHHNKRHQHTVTPCRHTIAAQTRTQQNRHSDNANMTTSDDMQTSPRGKGNNNLRKQPSIDINQIRYLNLLIPLTKNGKSTAEA